MSCPSTRTKCLERPTNAAAEISRSSRSTLNVWSFSQWAAKFAQLLGRNGGLSSLSPDELSTLRAFHTKHDRVHETLVRQAFAQAEPKSIPQILWQLQLLLQEGKNL